MDSQDQTNPSMSRATPSYDALRDWLRSKLVADLLGAAGMSDTTKSDPASPCAATPSKPTAEQDSGHGLFAPSSYEAAEQFLNAILGTTPSPLPPSRRQSQGKEEEEEEDGTPRDKEKQKQKQKQTQTQQDNGQGETTPTDSCYCCRCRHVRSRSAVAETWRTQAIGLVGLALLIHEVRHEVLADDRVARVMVTAAGEREEELFKEADGEDKNTTIGPGPAVTKSHSRRRSSDNNEFEVEVEVEEEEEEEVDSWARGVEELTVRLLESLGGVGRQGEERREEEDDQDIQDGSGEGGGGGGEEESGGWFYETDSE